VSIYYFCNDCEHKTTITKGGKIVKYSCPARFSPYDEKCPHKEKFQELEAQKQGRTYARPTQVVRKDEPSKK
jgi:rRNA maturation protein Nop10